MIDGSSLDAQELGLEHPAASDAFPASPLSLPLPQQVPAVREAAQALRSIHPDQRSAGLQAMAAALEADRDEILEANTLDLETSQEMAVPPLVQAWLKLTPERLQSAIAILQDLSRTSDPIQQVIPGQYQPQNAQVYGQRVPWGVVVLVSEAFPALGAIAAGLCLRTANALIVRGSSETSHSNRAIFRSLRQALDLAELPPALTLLPVEQGISIQDVLSQPGLDLVVPYGRQSLIRQVLTSANVPTIVPGLGNCYLYWSATAPVERVSWMIKESHYGEPESVNALEKVLVSASVKLSTLERLWQELHETGFTVGGDETLRQQYPQLPLVEGSSWSEPSHDRRIAFRRVEDMPAAIDWINHHSSGHADAIATSSYEESRQFSARLSSSTVYINASPRFERHPGSGAHIALGMASQISARGGSIQGRIGVDALTRMSQIILG